MFFYIDVYVYIYIYRDSIADYVQMIQSVERNFLLDVFGVQGRLLRFSF